MPQPAQHSLVQVLLLWITILSIIQVVFVTLFFTQDKSQNCTAVDPGHAKLSTANNKPVSDTLRLGKGKMLSFTGYSENGMVKWKPKFPSTELLSVNEHNLTIWEDGSYFINLQVTLKSCKENSQSGDNKVCLRLVKGPNENPVILLQGRIKNDTCSTGLLARVVGLTEGTLEVTINRETFIIDSEESLTHLDIIYMNA